MKRCSSMMTAALAGLSLMAWASAGHAVSYSVTAEQITSMPVTGGFSSNPGRTIGNRIYFLGGWKPNSGYTMQCFDQIRVFDLTSGTWSELGFRLPYEMADSLVCAGYYNNHFYIAPGWATGNNNGWGSHKKMIDVNLSAGTAQETANAFSSGAIWNIAACVVGSKVYFF
jgi:hypothetical protein